MPKFPQKFYSRDTATLARDLLGQRLVRVFRGRRRAGIIVETEAYLGAGDPACHTWKNRKSNRNAAMYLPGGHAYIYLIYGMHYCFNVVAKGADEPEAVLVRAIEPTENVNERCDGPGRLCRALRITRALDAESLTGETIFIEQGPHKVARNAIGAGPRIGVDYAGDAAHWPLRFYVKGSPHLSRKEKTA